MVGVGVVIPSCRPIFDLPRRPAPVWLPPAAGAMGSPPSWCPLPPILLRGPGAGGRSPRTPLFYYQLVAEDLYVVRYNLQAAEPELDDEDWGVREVFANFGLSCYSANVLEHGMVNALALSAHIYGGGKIGDDDPWTRHFAATMGQLVKRLNLDTSSDLPDRLDDAVTKRNWLIHQFWRLHAVAFTHPDGRIVMIQKLRALTDLFKDVDEVLSLELLMPALRSVGITDEKWRDLLQFGVEQQRADGPESVSVPGLQL